MTTLSQKMAEALAGKNLQSYDQIADVCTRVAEEHFSTKISKAVDLLADDELYLDGKWLRVHRVAKTKGRKVRVVVVESLLFDYNDKVHGRRKS